MGMADQFYPADDQRSKDLIKNCELCSKETFCPEHKFAKALNKKKEYNSATEAKKAGRW